MSRQQGTEPLAEGPPFGLRLSGPHAGEGVAPLSKHATSITFPRLGRCDGNVGWWRPAAWKQFKTRLPEWMDSQLEHWQEQALAIDARERQVRRELEKVDGIELPIGVGALSWITLQLEIRGWERFQNRRQIACSRHSKRSGLQTEPRLLSAIREDLQHEILLRF
jgi:hypothetical protein